MRIVLLGAPGSGKGTQASFLVERYQVPHISTGELLRAAVATRTELGKRAKAAMQAGDLVSDDIVIGLIEQRLRESDARRGFILDGFPRNIPQAQELDRRLGLLTRPLQIAMYVDVSETLLLKRLTGRLTCEGCGAIFNRYFSPPKKRGLCDQCGSKKLVRRADDNEKTVAARLQTYKEQTQPLIDYYKAQHKLRTVPGDGDVDEISRRVMAIISAEVRPLESKIVEPASAHRHTSQPSTIIAGGAVTKTKPVPPTRAAAKAAATGEAASERETGARKKTTAKKAVHKAAIGKKQGTAKAAPSRVGTKKAAAKKNVAAQTRGSASKVQQEKSESAKRSAPRKAGAGKSKTQAPAKKKPVAKNTTAKKSSASKKTTAKKSSVSKKTTPAQTAKKKTGKKAPARKTASGSR